MECVFQHVSFVTATHSVVITAMKTTALALTVRIDTVVTLVMHVMSMPTDLITFIIELMVVVVYCWRCTLHFELLVQCIRC